MCKPELNFVIKMNKARRYAFKIDVVFVVHGHYVPLAAILSGL
jgi:hypothetical protein